MTSMKNSRSVHIIRSPKWALYNTRNIISLLKKEKTEKVPLVNEYFEITSLSCPRTEAWTVCQISIQMPHARIFCDTLYPVCGYLWQHITLLGPPWPCIVSDLSLCLVVTRLAHFRYSINIAGMDKWISAFLYLARRQEEQILWCWK